MDCKFCNGPLEGDEIRCPHCGEQLAQEKVSKKKIWKIIVAVVASLLCAAIVVGAIWYAVAPMAAKSDVAKRADYTVTGEVSEDVANQVVAVAGDKELTNSELQFYYWYSVNNFVSYYGSYLDSLGLDIDKPLEDQVWDEQAGETWQHFFLANALNTWHRNISVQMQADEANYQLDAQSQETVDTMADQLQQMAEGYGYANALDMIRADFGPVSDDQGYMSYINTSMISNGYYATLYDGIVPTAEEVEAHYESKVSEFESAGMGKDAGKTVDVRHILITPEQTETEDGTTTITDEQWEACRVKAQALLDAYLAGEVTEDAFAQLATENSQDPGSAANGGLYTQVYVGQMVEPFEDWCFDESRKTGDTGLVQTDYGYHIMYFVADQEVWFVGAQSDLINERTEEMILAGMEKWPMEVNYRKIALGEPDKAETGTVPAS